jgi:hypothetical protein
MQSIIQFLNFRFAVSFGLNVNLLIELYATKMLKFQVVKIFKQYYYFFEFI